MTIPEPAVRVRVLENPTEEQLAEATAVTVRAYGWGPSLRTMTGEKPELKGILYESEFRAAALRGRVLVVTPHDSETILAVAIWYGPGRNMLETAEERVLGWNEFQESLDPATKTWWSKEHPAMVKIANEYFGEGVITNSWFLFILATDPVHQRKGYGSMLVRAGLRLGAEGKAKVATGTWATELAEWFKRMGFNPFGTLKMGRTDLDPPAEFIANWFICEDPESHP